MGKMTSIFSKPKNKRLARDISIRSPTAFRESIRKLERGGLSREEERALVLARTRAAMQLRRDDLSRKERRQFEEINSIKIPKMTIKSKLTFVILSICLLLGIVYAATSLSFVSPTPSAGSTIPGTSIPINVSSSGIDHYLVVDKNGDLLLRVRFDDFNSTGGVLDLSSYRKNGSVVGTVTYPVGRWGNTSNIVNSASFVNFSGASQLTAPTYVTIEAWINVPAIAGRASRVIAGKHGGGTGGEYFLATTPTGLRFTAINGTPSRANCDYALEYNVSQWINIVGTYNGTTMLMYINGTQVSITCDATISGRLQSTVANFLIGNYMAGDQNFNGSIDEVAVWNRSISSQEVKAIYNASISTNNYYNNFTGLAAGQYNFSVYAINTSGYQDTLSRTINLGTPTVTITGTNLNYTNWWMHYNQTLPLNMTCTDGSSTSYSYYWLVNDAIYNFGSDPYFLFDPDGEEASDVVIGRNNITAVCQNVFGSTTAREIDIEILNNDDIVLIAMPDTQYYSQLYPFVYSNQTRWITEIQNQVNLPFVIHEGDVVQDSWNATQWINANASMSILDQHSTWYEVTSGNHDYNDIAHINDYGLENFTKYFPLGRFSRMPTFVNTYNGTVENSYHVFNASGKKFLALSYEFCPRNSTLDWANSVIGNNSDRYVIIDTHMFMNYNNERTNFTSDYSCFAYNLTGIGNPGNTQWNYTVQNYNNIFMVLSGHILNDGTGYRNDTGINGNTVHQILANYQTETGNPEGGNGWLRLYILRPSTNTISAETYSPYIDLVNWTASDQTFNMGYNFSYLNTPATPSSITACNTGDFASILIIQLVGVFLILLPFIYLYTSANRGDQSFIDAALKLNVGQIIMFFVIITIGLALEIAIGNGTAAICSY